MCHSIDPKTDRVFKTLLGTEIHRARLIHCLNAMPRLKSVASSCANDINAAPAMEVSINCFPL